MPGKSSTKKTSKIVRQTKMLNFFWPLLAVIHSLDPWQSSAQLQALQSCAKVENSIEVSKMCFYQAKYPRSRRASSTFLKSELEAMCSLPCQKSRLFTTPEVEDFSLLVMNQILATRNLIQWLDSLQDQRCRYQTWWIHWYRRLHWLLPQVRCGRIRSRLQ